MLAGVAHPGGFGRGSRSAFGVRGRLRDGNRGAVGCGFVG